jgi:hypothetical protein
MTDDKKDFKLLTFTKPDDKEEELTPETILKAAEGKLTAVLLVGWTEEGSFYMSTSQGAVADNLLLLEVSKTLMLEYLMGDAE